MHYNAQSPVYGFMKNPSMVDYPKHLAAVFFTTGCNFTCGFCHNAPLMGRKQKGLTWGRLEEACAAFRDNWINGVVITGGEPTLEPELETLIRFFKDKGWHVKLDTNGSMPDVVEKVLPLVDYVAMDIKAGPDGYPRLVGYDRMDRIKRSIRLVMEQAAEYEFRTTVIESFHDEKQMRGAAEMIRGAKRYVIQPFLPSADLPDEKMRALPRTSAGAMRQVQQWVQPLVEKVMLRGD